MFALFTAFPITSAADTNSFVTALEFSSVLFHFCFFSLPTQLLFQSTPISLVLSTHAMSSLVSHISWTPHFRIIRMGLKNFQNNPGNIIYLSIPRNANAIYFLSWKKVQHSVLMKLPFKISNWGKPDSSRLSKVHWCGTRRKCYMGISSEPHFF